MQALHINGNDLTLEDVREVAVDRRPVLLAPDAREAVNGRGPSSTRSSPTIRVSYAITTGVGKLSDVHIVGDQIRELQVNLIRSHAVGVGEPLAVTDTRAMMLLRANSLAKGFSGVRAVHRYDLRDAESRSHSVCALAGKRGRQSAISLRWRIWRLR